MKKSKTVLAAEKWMAGVKFAIENEGGFTKRDLKAKGDACYSMYASAFRGEEHEEFGWVHLDMAEAMLDLGDMMYRDAGLEPLTRIEVEEKFG